MSSLKTDAIEAATGTNTNLALTGKGTGKVALGDAALLVPDADGAAGQILTTDGSLALTFAATPGSSGNVLTSNGSAWTSAAAAGGGAWTLISSTAASDTASVTITGLDSTYETYALIFSNAVPSTDNGNLYLRIGTSGGILTAANYGWHLPRNRPDSTLYSATAGEGDSFWMIANGVGNVASENANGTLFLPHPSDTASFPIMYGGVNSFNNAVACNIGFMGGEYLAAATVTQVQFLFSNGNIESGRFSVWGISHA